MATIPNKLHFIWLGSPISGVYKLLIDRWFAMYPDWEITVWDGAMCLNLIQQMGTGLADRFDDPKLPFSTKSDIARYHILAKEGGVYIDTDFLPLRRMDKLLEHPFFGVYERVDKSRIATAVIGSPPDHWMCKVIFEVIRDADYTLSPVQSAGPGMFTRICEAALGSNPASMAILDVASFFPVLYGQQHTIESWYQRDLSACYAAHLWAGSWTHTPQGEHQLCARIGALSLAKIYRPMTEQENGVVCKTTVPGALPGSDSSI